MPLVRSSPISDQAEIEELNRIIREDLAEDVKNEKEEADSTYTEIYNSGGDQVVEVTTSSGMPGPEKVKIDDYKRQFSIKHDRWLKEHGIRNRP